MEVFIMIVLVIATILIEVTLPVFAEMYKFKKNSKVSMFIDYPTEDNKNCLSVDYKGLTFGHALEIKKKYEEEGAIVHLEIKTKEKGE